MSAIEYTKDIKVSEIELLLIQKFRWLISEKYGSLILMKVHNGEVTDSEKEIDIRVKISDDRGRLRQAQS